MLAKLKVFSHKSANLQLEAAAKQYRLTVTDYLSKLAPNSSVIIKHSNSGFKVAVWDDGSIMFLDNRIAELEFKDNPRGNIRYSGCKLVPELEYWRIMGLL